MVTLEPNRVFWEQTLKLPHTIHPDKLADLKTTPLVEGASEKRIITDGTRRLEFYDCEGNANDDGPLIVHLPREKMLIEADAFTPPPPDTVEPDLLLSILLWTKLYDNLVRLRLDVKQTVPMHGRVVSMDCFLEAVGKSPL